MKQMYVDLSLYQKYIIVHSSFETLLQNIYICNFTFFFRYLVSSLNDVIYNQSISLIIVLLLIVQAKFLKFSQKLCYALTNESIMNTHSQKKYTENM